MQHYVAGKKLTNDMIAHAGFVCVCVCMGKSKTTMCEISFIFGWIGTHTHAQIIASFFYIFWRYIGVRI